MTDIESNYVDRSLNRLNTGLLRRQQPGPSDDKALEKLNARFIPALRPSEDGLRKHSQIKTQQSR